MISSLLKATVYIYLPKDGYVPAGLLKFDPARESCSFGYGRKYVDRPNAIPIDPVTLPLSLAGEKHSQPGEALFAAIRDAAPDSWGRKILSLMAEKHGQTLNEFELLTAGFTDNKIGGLAFGPSPQSGPQSMAPWFEKQTFVRATEDLNKISQVVHLVDSAEEDELDELRQKLPYDEFIRALALSPSVGGGRPKCLYRHNGLDFIVKFSKVDDHWDEPVVEHATMTLAAKCDICVAQTSVQSLERGHCIFVRRFDRNEKGKPLHFISGYAVGDIVETGDWKSYQHLALESRRYGDPDAGEELFRRMIFNMICSNIDDHPRNQAFFVSRNRIAITPAYDIVPTSWSFKEYTMALRCGKHSKQASLENALSEIPSFGISQDRAEEIVERILNTCRNWREHFRDQGVADKDIVQLEDRFRLVE
jgi:serine/threonine-protein kinase HipA